MQNHNCNNSFVLSDLPSGEQGVRRLKTEQPFWCMIYGLGELRYDAAHGVAVLWPTWCDSCLRKKFYFLFAKQVCDKRCLDLQLAWLFMLDGSYTSTVRKTWWLENDSKICMRAEKYTVYLNRNMYSQSFKFENTVWSRNSNFRIWLDKIGTLSFL